MHLLCQLSSNMLDLLFIVIPLSSWVKTYCNGNKLILHAVLSMSMRVPPSCFQTLWISELQTPYNKQSCLALVNWRPWLPSLSQSNSCWTFLLSSCCHLFLALLFFPLNLVFSLCIQSPVILSLVLGRLQFWFDLKPTDMSFLLSMEAIDFLPSVSDRDKYYCKTVETVRKKWG